MGMTNRTSPDSARRRAVESAFRIPQSAIRIILQARVSSMPIVPILPLVLFVGLVVFVI